ncbi:YitT family protein [Arcicella sp. LKC2W]|uniref:YitT family protein n=1 Tax=Arcicella sp. LKC2W TaxID=2984198 RepID=UPI002B20BB86|nr:YitT family protein [Arcicella sp. LKC2W]MEA5457529.1 YitT family protein [Arcicella sp. LKC2W]
MNPILKQLVIDTLTRKLNQKPKDFNAYSSYELEKGLIALKSTLRGYFKDFLFITAGVFSAAFGFKGFLLTNHFIDGGATGISLLISALTSIPLAILLVVVNIPFILLGYRIMGKSFAIKTALAISGLALVVATISFPNITNDNLLVALFGGFFLGAGIGLSVRGGAVIDGTEVLAIFLSRKFGTTMGDIIIMINVLIFGTAAYFLSVEIALYSMVTYLAASKTLDFVIEGIEEYTGVTIVSTQNDEIREMIITKLGHGVTMYNGRGGYGKMGESKSIEIIYTVVTRLELNKLNEAINNIDPEAFVVMSSIKDTKGGMIKKRPLDH